MRGTYGRYRGQRSRAEGTAVLCTGYHRCTWTTRRAPRMHPGPLNPDALITARLAESPPSIRGADMPVPVRRLYYVPGTAAPCRSRTPIPESVGSTMFPASIVAPTYGSFVTSAAPLRSA